MPLFTTTIEAPPQIHDNPYNLGTKEVKKKIVSAVAVTFVPTGLLPPPPLGVVRVPRGTVGHGDAYLGTHVLVFCRGHALREVVRLGPVYPRRGVTATGEPKEVRTVGQDTLASGEDERRSEGRGGGSREDGL